MSAGGVEHASAFARDGFVLVPGLLAADALAAARARYDDAVAAARHGGHARRDGVVTPGLVWLFRPGAMLDEGDLARVRTLAARLLDADPEAVVTGYRIFHKPARAGAATCWHQDEAYRSPHRADVSLNVWIALDAVGSEASPMMYHAGSHRRGLLPHAPVAGHAIELQAEGIRADGATSFDLQEGDALCHHCRTLHAARANRAPRPRRALVVVCTVPGRPIAAPAVPPWRERLRPYWS